MMIAAPTVLLKRLFGMVLLAIALQMLLKEGHALWLNA
jgi:uncharacterized membrane protein YfcA